VIFVSFPDVVGAFAPAIRSALVNTVSTFRVVEEVSPTHANTNKSIYSSLTFQFFQKDSLHKHCI